MGGVELGLLAEPGELPLAIVAVALLSLGDGFGFARGTIEDFSSLLIAERGEGPAAAAEALDQLTGFFHQALREHGFCAPVDALVKHGAGGVEREAQDAVAGEGIASFAPLAGDGGWLAGAGGERDLERADELGGVVGVDAFGSLGVEALEAAVKMRASATACALAKQAAKCGLRRRAWEESVDQRAKVEAGAAGKDRKHIARGKLRQRRASVAGVVPRGAGLGGLVEIEQVMRNKLLLRERGLGRTELHVAIHADGVAGEDFCRNGCARQLLSQEERERCFAGSGRAGKDDERAHRVRAATSRGETAAAALPARAEGARPQGQAKGVRGAAPGAHGGARRLGAGQVAHLVVGWAKRSRPEA